MLDPSFPQSDPDSFKHIRLLRDDLIKLGGIKPPALLSGSRVFDILHYHTKLTDRRRDVGAVIPIQSARLTPDQMRSKDFIAIEYDFPNDVPRACALKPRDVPDDRDRGGQFANRVDGEKAVSRLKAASRACSAAVLAASAAQIVKARAIRLARLPQVFSEKSTCNLRASVGLAR
jgi:hypothetical protein